MPDENENDYRPNTAAECLGLLARQFGVAFSRERFFAQFPPEEEPDSETFMDMARFMASMPSGLMLTGIHWLTDKLHSSCT